MELEETLNETICRRETFLSAIANNEGSGGLPDPICREEVYLKQIAENGIGSGSGTTNYAALTNKPSINGVELSGNKTTAELGITSSGSSSTPIVEVSGSSVTLEPNKHYVISGVTNRLTINLSEAIESELKQYSFEFTTIDRIPTITINGVDQPYLYEYERYTRYLCEIVNNHLVIIGTYDGYAYQFVYGTYATADWTSSYSLKNDRTFAFVGTETKEGTYIVEYSTTNSRYEIYLTYDDTNVETAYWSEDGTITVNGVVYTKS